MAYTAEKLATLLAKLRVLGIDEPGLWVGFFGEDGNMRMRHKRLSQLTPEEARRGWPLINHEVQNAIKKHRA